MDAARSLLIWGAGDQARVVAETARHLGYVVKGFVGRVGEASGGGFELFDEDAARQACAAGEGTCCFPGIGDNATRIRVLAQLNEMGCEIPVLIDPSALVQSRVDIGNGTLLAAGAMVITESRIGKACIVNTAATVDHHCDIGDGVHIAPGVHLGGRVTVGAGAWVGIGAVVRNGVTIGEGAIVGAGAVVVEDIPPRVVAYGVPARVVRSLT